MNLALEVLGKRGDGYHEIVTVMQAVDLRDRLVLEDAPDLMIQASDGVPGDASNLAVRAAAALRDAARLDRGAHIALDKRIPVAAGLGGGSSDAAAVLLGLNRLWGLRWPVARLAEVAVRVGMDVPFFLRGGVALATGRGEHIEAVPGMGLALVLVNPGVGMSTAEVYGGVTPEMYTDGRRARALVTALASRHAARVARSLYNGLEGAAMAGHPEIGRMKAALLAAGALGASMSGSGPTVFALARSFEHARQIRNRVARGSWGCWAVRTLGAPAVRAEAQRNTTRRERWGVAKW